MANLRIFISSTAYDLGVLRSSLRAFIEGLGYDAVLSDYSDVLYDPREHAHKSCLAEVRTCDMVVLVIGSRFGSPLSPDVLKTSLQDLDAHTFLDGGSELCLSVTQAEALAAAARGIPLFPFVEAGVYHDYSVYQRNKSKPFAAEIAYPSISQPDTAEYIFDFIDYLQGRSFNNAVISFDRIEDVVTHLQKQWAALFQRMLSEARTGRDDSVRIDRLADQFEDLKAALLATVGDAGSRDTARAVIRSRRLVDFLRALPNVGVPMRDAFVAGDMNLMEMLELTADVVGVEQLPSDERDRVRMSSTLLRTSGEDDLICRWPLSMLDRIQSDWQNLRNLSPSDRAVVYDALLDTDDRGPRLVQRLSSGGNHPYFNTLPNSILAGGRLSREGVARVADDSGSVSSVLNTEDHAASTESPAVGGDGAAPSSSLSQPHPAGGDETAEG